MILRHGVFTQYVDTSPRPVTTVPSNIIALVCTVPTYRLNPGDVTLNVPQRCIGDIDDARFVGPKTPGFTGPYAVDAIRDNGGGTVEIINVFDADVHKASAAAIDYTFAGNKIQLEKVAASTRISGTNAEGLTGAFEISGQVEGTDYTVNRVTGEVERILGGGIAADATISVTYTYADPGAVDASDIVGAVVGGERTGLQSLRDLYQLRGYKAKMILAPVWSEDGGVAAEMEAIAETTGAYFLLDAPAGTTRDEAIAGRSGTAPVGTFATDSRHAILCYPRVKASDGTLQPLSQYVAGVIAGTDKDQGYWWSPSNHGINGITGTELRLSADYASTDTDVNALNAAGIVTVFAGGFGSGYRVWGNYSAGYPVDSAPINFIPVGRTLDIELESVQRACFVYVDRPINPVLIDAIVATANGRAREAIQEGALVSGSRWFWNEGNNPATSLAAGRLVINYELMVPTPAQEIVLKGTLNINLLSNITPTTTLAA